MMPRPARRHSSAPRRMRATPPPLSTEASKAIPMSIPNPLTRTADKAGVIGAIVTAMGCAACFPALASLGAAIGLGFLSQYEGVFIRYLLPLFAVLALLANVIGGLRHRQWPRMRSEKHTSELQSLMRISYAVFCLKKKKTYNT